MLKVPSSNPALGNYEKYTFIEIFHFFKFLKKNCFYQKNCHFSNSFWLYQLRVRTSPIKCYSHLRQQNFKFQMKHGVEVRQKCEKKNMMGFILAFYTPGYQLPSCCKFKRITDFQIFEWELMWFWNLWFPGIIDSTIFNYYNKPFLMVFQHTALNIFMLKNEFN